MASTLSQINLGTYENDGTGDDLREAFLKVVHNFSVIHADIIVTESGTVTAVANLGTGTPVAAGLVNGGVGKTLQLRSIAAGDNVVVTSTSDTISIEAVYPTFKLDEDNAPALSGELDLNSNSIIGTGEININGNITATTVNANIVSTGTSVFNSVDINAGTLDGVNIGESIRASGKFTDIEAGEITGTVTGTVSDISNHNLADLHDVIPGTPRDGDCLRWDALTSKWVGESSAPFKIPSFSDATRDALTPNNGDMIYNSTSHAFQGYADGEWVNLTV